MCSHAEAVHGALLALLLVWLLPLYLMATSTALYSVPEAVAMAVVMMRVLPHLTMMQALFKDGTTEPDTSSGYTWVRLSICLHKLLLALPYLSALSLEPLQGMHTKLLVECSYAALLSFSEQMEAPAGVWLLLLEGACGALAARSLGWQGLCYAVMPGMCGMAVGRATVMSQRSMT